MLENRMRELSCNFGELEELRHLERELIETNLNLEKHVEDLHKSEARYRELAESITDLFFALDKELRYTYWNKALERFAGTPAAGAIGKSIYQAFQGDSEARDRAAAVYSEVLRTGEAKTFLNKYRYKDSEIFFEIHVYPVEEGLTVFAKDVTARLKAQEELLIRSEELDAFALAVSHDLAGSMVFVGDFARTAIRACSENDTERTVAKLQEILEAVDKTQDYIEKLVDYARAGCVEEENMLAKSEEILRVVLDELGPRIEDAGAEVNVSSRLPDILASPVKLQQVLHNLICNSLDHARCERILIAIGAKRTGDKVIFYVRDNGKGISPELCKAIFMPFKRSQDVEVPGWGIGLALVKRAVESWGGRIWLKSDPGYGCCFFFSARIAE